MIGPVSRQTWRRLALAAFLVALFASRGCNLGDKALHHDESLFGYYSYYLSAYGSYRYEPILHGPLLIELVGGGFRLFGDNDTTLRLVPLVCGLLLFALVLLLRPWLGRQGTLAALLLLLVSPDLCYYSRFLRNDVLFLMLTMLNLVAIAWTLRGKGAWPIVLWPVSLALLVSNKENIVFLAASQIGFALLWIALDTRHVLQHSSRYKIWRREPAQRLIHTLICLNLSLVVWLAIYWVYVLFIRPYLPLGIWARAIWIVGVITLAAYIDAILVARDDPRRRSLVYRLYRSVLTEPYWWIAGVALATALLYFSFSILLTQPRSLFALIRETVLYWWGEHASERLGGPFHIYAPQLLLYEVPAWLIVIAALLRDGWRNRRRRWFEFGLWLIVAAGVWATSLWTIESTQVDAGGSTTVLRWTAYDWLGVQLQQYWDYLHLRTAGAVFWAASIVYWAGIWTVRSIRSGHLVRGWFIFWLATSYLFYGYAGEKVPWLALHIALPLWLLAAILWNEWSEHCAVEGRTGRWRVSVAAGVVLLAWTGWQTGILCLVHPTDPAELAVYNHTHPEAKAVALDIREALETGRVRDTEVTIQGEACWPYTWYLREYQMVDFAAEDLAPTPEDRLVVTDHNVAHLYPMLTSDFTSRTFPLRYAWTPPAIPFNQLLGLRGVWGEPQGFWKKMRFRARRSRRMLWPVVRYVFLRKPYTTLELYASDWEGSKQPDLDAMAINPLPSIYWQRVRVSPEPLLPPPDPVSVAPPESLPTTAPVEIEDFLPLMEGPATGTVPARMQP